MDAGAGADRTSARIAEQGAGDVSVLEAAGRALFRLGRIVSRQPMGQIVLGSTQHAVEVSRILVVQAVEAGPEEPDGEVAVRVVARRLGIDPSTASRLIADTIQAGYLSRRGSPSDARRVSLLLTEAGQALSRGAQRYQRAVFEQATHGWPDPERLGFARLLPIFVEAVANSRPDGPSPHTSADE